MLDILCEWFSTQMINRNVKHYFLRKNKTKQKKTHISECLLLSVYLLSNLQITRTGITSAPSLNFNQTGPSLGKWSGGG